MKGLWTVFRLELRLLLRSRGIWLLAPVTAFFGVWEASAVREFPIGAWGQFTTAAMFVTLILALSTGGQIVRDRDRRVDAVLLGTPVATPAYVWGKYLAALVVLLGLALPMLVGAIATDRFDTWSDPPAVFGHSHYPPLGPWPYVGAWLLLVLVPVVFGAALALATVTLTAGQRVVGSMLAVFLWVGPGFLESALFNGWGRLLDVAGLTFIDAVAAPTLPPDLQQIAFTGQTPPPALAAQVVQIMQANLPPTLPAIFYWNRALFAALALLLVLVTVYRLRAYRRGR